MKDFIDYVVSGDEQDELAKTKAELSYALHCLEREIAIAQQAQSQLASAEDRLAMCRNQFDAAMRKIDATSDQLASARKALEALHNADELDWKHLDVLLGFSGHGQFWRGVFVDVRAALKDARS